MKTIQTLQDALSFELKGLLNTEKQLQKHLPHVAAYITSSKLKKEVDQYLTNTDKRSNKLYWAFQYMNEKVLGRHSKITEAILKESEALLSNIEIDKVRDEVAIHCIQRILHYKISVYRTCGSYAHLLRIHSAEEIIKEVLQLEEKADHILSELAATEIDDEADIAIMNK